MEELNEKVQPKKGLGKFLMQKISSGLHGTLTVFIKKHFFPWNETEGVPIQRLLLDCPTPHILVTVGK